MMQLIVFYFILIITKIVFFPFKGWHEVLHSRLPINDPTFLNSMFIHPMGDQINLFTKCMNHDP